MLLVGLYKGAGQWGIEKIRQQTETQMRAQVAGMPASYLPLMH